MTEKTKVKETVVQPSRDVEDPNDHSYRMRNDGLRYVGQRLSVREARQKVTGKAVYTSDIHPRNLLHGKILFSTIPHGLVKSIDTSEAEQLDGVVAISTCLDGPKATFNSGLRFIGHEMKPDEKVFNCHVRFAGDRIGAVVAETEKIAEEAIRRIKVEYEPYPAVYDVKEALNQKAYPIHEGGNLIGEIVSEAGDARKAIPLSAHVFSGQYHVPAVHHYAMELHSTLAHWDGERLTVWTSGQNIFAFRLILSQVLDLPVNRIRVIKPMVGGGFGGKVEAVLEPVAAYMTMITGRPVRFELSRKETMISTRTRHEAVVSVRTGFNHNLELQGLEFNVWANGGAYASATTSVLGGMSAKSMILYDTPNIRFCGLGVYTNTPIGGAMRGYGSPQIMTALELHMNEVALALDVDPVELRMKNLVRPHGPHPKGGSLGNARIRDCLAMGVKMFGWPKGELKPVVPGRKRAIGFACGAHGNGVYPKHFDATHVKLTLLDDGSIVLITGNQEIGAGLTTTQTQIIGEVLGIDPGSIALIESDTDTTPFDIGTFASRGTWVGGKSAQGAAEMIRKQMSDVAAEILGVAAGSLRFNNGVIYSEEGPREKVTFRDVALYTQQYQMKGEISVSNPYYSTVNPGSYGVHFADVEVDPESGEVKVHRILAVHDVGKAINPLMVEGQIEGGIQMGLGYALREKIMIDTETGQVTNAHTKKYPMFRAIDMPEVTIALIEEGEEPGPFGAKSIGEIATVPTAAAVINGLNAALGTQFRTLPVIPDVILKKISDDGDQSI